MTAMQTLGQRIRELREAQDLSLREFARRLGNLSAAFLSDIELGRRFPSGDVLSKMAHALNVTVQDLKSHDTRPPLEELKRLAASDPTFGMALRKVVEKKVTGKELLELTNRAGRKKNQ